MREIYVLLVGLILTSFLMNLPVEDPYLPYLRAKLRAFQLYSELESLEGRALIYARVVMDEWLLSQNGTGCRAIPNPPDMAEFLHELEEDLVSKGFHLFDSIVASLRESKYGMSGDARFGGGCVDGGLSVRLSGRIVISDPSSGIRGARDISAIGCHDAKFISMVRLLDSIERSLSILAIRSRIERMDREDFSRALRWIVTFYSDRSEDLGLDLRLAIEWSNRDFKGLYNLKVLISVRDPEATMIDGSRLAKGLTCVREITLKVRLTDETNTGRPRRYPV